MRRPFLSAGSLLPAPLLRGAGQRGTKRASRERAALPRPCPGSAASLRRAAPRCEWGWGRAGKMALPGFLPAFVAQFRSRLSSPTGAILRPFLPPPRRVGRGRRCVCLGGVARPGLQIHSPKSQKLDCVHNPPAFSFFL